MKFLIDFQCQNITKRYSENRENAYLAMKNPSASGALRQAPTPGQLVLASLCRQYMLKEIWGPPLTKSWIRYCCVLIFLTKAPDERAMWAIGIKVD